MQEDLVGGCIPDVSALEACILKNMALSAKQCTPYGVFEANENNTPIKELVREESAALAAAVTPNSRYAASKTLFAKRKQIKRRREELAFDTKCLCAPREDKKTRPTTSLLIEGVQTYDPQVWKAEFLSLYAALYTDEANNVDVQKARLHALHVSSATSSRIFVPRWMVFETFSQCARKSKTAAGLDNISWTILSLLPVDVVEDMRRIFEHRINGDEGHIQIIDEWCMVLLHLIPKVKEPKLSTEFRPVALSSCLQKMYMRVLVELLRYHSKDVLPVQFGFTPTRQTADVSEPCRQVLHKSTQWGRRVHMVKVDVKRAFDNINHDKLEASLLDSECHPRLIEALFRDISFARFDLSFAGHHWQGGTYSKGGRQGASETPDLWRVLLNSPLKASIEEFERHGYGLHFEASSAGYTSTGDPSDYIRMVAWADDCILLAKSRQEAISMLGIFVKHLRAWGLDYKPGSLEYLSNGEDFCALGPCGEDWDLDGEVVKVRCRSSMCILGVLLDKKGSSIASARHRAAQAWTHFWARKKTFCRRHISLRKRVSRFYETVGRTFLHNAGGWAYDDALCSFISSLDQSFWRVLLCRSPQCGETQGEFIHRTNALIEKFRIEWKMPTLLEHAMKAHFGWCGHLVRHPSMANALVKWRDRNWCTSTAPDGKLFPSGNPRVRFARKGPQVMFEDLVAREIPDWQLLSQDRSGWRTSSLMACRSVLRSFGRPCVGANYLKHISNRLKDWSRGCKWEYPVSVCLLSDSQVAVSQVLGLYQAPSDPCLMSYVGFLRWSLHALVESGVKPVYRNLLIHRNREENVEADSVASTVLDKRCTVFHCTPCEIPVGAFLLASSDGAARRVGGSGESIVYESACASVLSVVDLRSGTAFPIAWWGVQLGSCSSMVAEFEGVCLSIYLILCWASVSGLLLPSN
jgi:hypothetical protein